MDRTACRRRIRHAKASVQAIVVGLATLVGGAATVPQLMTSLETNVESTRELSSKSISQPQGLSLADPGQPISDSDHTVTTSKEVQYSQLAPVTNRNESQQPNNSNDSLGKDSDKLVNASVVGSSIDDRTVNKPSPSVAISRTTSSDGNDALLRPTSIKVFFATDRAFVRANDIHLWAITIIPCGLAIAICVILLLQSVFAQKRRWIWWTVFAGSIALTCLIGHQAIIQSGQLYRMAVRENVWFSTQRYESGASEYPLQLGVSEVSLPKNRLPGELPTPSIFKLEFSEQADRHVTIQRIDRMSADDFFTGVNNTIQHDDTESAFVFIHGYNVLFDDAMRRTAQIAADINFKGASILYSWPSRGKLLSYTWDESNVAWSVTHLERFLMDLRHRTNAKKIHLVAHSMGNRALMGALELLALRFPAQQPMFGQVVMAAPDVDTDDFLKRYASSVSTCATRATLYASSSDRALVASMKIHGYRRLGLTSSPQPTVEGIDVVDVSPIDTSLLGHSYYGSHPMMIRELRELIDSGTGPIDRRWLMTAQESQTPPLWRFRLPELTAQTPVPLTR